MSESPDARVGVVALRRPLRRRSRRYRSIDVAASRPSTPQILGHVEGGRVAIRSPLGQGLEADPLQLLGNPIVDLARRLDLLAGDLLQQFVLASRRKRCGVPSAVRRAPPPGCRCRCGRRRGALRREPVRGSCKPACRIPRPFAKVRFAEGEPEVDDVRAGRSGRAGCCPASRRDGPGLACARNAAPRPRWPPVRRRPRSRAVTV